MKGKIRDFDIGIVEVVEVGDVVDVGPSEFEYCVSLVQLFQENLKLSQIK